MRNISDTSLSSLLYPTDALLVQTCLGWGVDSPLPIATSQCPSPSSSPPSSLAQPFNAASPHHLQCQLSPSSIISTFFPTHLALHPGLLTHFPTPSCSHGVYVIVEEPYRDGMGNAMWSYAISLAWAMALNATVIHDDFQNSHSESEGVRLREEVLRFSEWEASKEWWDRCAPTSSVRANEVWVEYQHFDFSPHDDLLYSTRDQVRSLQVSLASQANTGHMGASLTATSTVRFLSEQHGNYSEVTLPRVDFISPGVTVHFKGIRLTHDWEYKGSLYPPAIEVSRILEIRYLAQQDGWRDRLFPHDLDDLSGGRGGEMAATSGLRAPFRSWRTSDRIHVAVPVRRGDVTRGTAGSDLTVNLDLRQRAVTDVAILQILQQTTALVKAIDAFNTSSTPSPSSLSSLPATLTGTDLLSRFLITVYSEGNADDFAELIAGIVQLRLRPFSGAAPTRRPHFPRVFSDGGERRDVSRPLLLLLRCRLLLQLRLVEAGQWVDVWAVLGL